MDRRAYSGSTSVRSSSAARNASPNLYETTTDAFLSEHQLGEEVFGPLGLVIRVKSADEMERLARGFEGQLTAKVERIEDALRDQ